MQRQFGGLYGPSRRSGGYAVDNGISLHRFDKPFAVAEHEVGDLAQVGLGEIGDISDMGIDLVHPFRAFAIYRWIVSEKILAVDNRNFIHIFLKHKAYSKSMDIIRLIVHSS